MAIFVCFVDCSAECCAAGGCGAEFWALGGLFGLAFGGGSGCCAGVVAGLVGLLGSAGHDFAGGGTPLVHAVDDGCSEDSAVVDVGLSVRVVLGECSPGFLAVKSWCGAPFQSVLDIADGPTILEEGFHHVENVFL